MEKKKYPLQKPVCGIYQITCKINHKIYIGQSKNIYARVGEHQKNLQEQKYENDFQYDYDRWGEEEFEWEVLEECDPEDLPHREQVYISQYSGTSRLYNLVVYKKPNRTRKKDLQGGRAAFGVISYYGHVGDYKSAFLALNMDWSWREISEPYGIHPNMARMISQGYDPGNKIREKLRLPMKDKFEVCPRCESPMKKDHRCSGGNHKKRNRLSINLEDPGSAGRSIMKHMDSGMVDDLIVILMEKMLRE